MSKIISPTQDEFMKCVSGHKCISGHCMEIMQSDGVYRHLRFKRPETSAYCFDIVTWPGSLCFTGDMHSYLFSRTPDMFEFFRQKGTEDSVIQINPDYWSEKLIAAHVSGRKDSGYTEYNKDLFKASVREWWLEHCRAENLLFVTSESLWKEIECDVIDVSRDGEQAAYEAARNFQSTESPRFTLEDLWETDFSAYTHHFIWCCYAIVWGIRQFDEAGKAGEEMKEIAA